MSPESNSKISPPKPPVMVSQLGDGFTCPKCGAESGDAWAECEGSCPMPGSPYYNGDSGDEHQPRSRTSYPYGEQPPVTDQGSKASNPKDAFGILKASPLSYVPQAVVMELAIAMAEGAFKYGAHNYLVIGVRASVYTDAAARHLAQFTNGEDYDSDSGTSLSHITKAIASLTVLRAAMIHGTWVDDRPPPAPPAWLEQINSKMHELAERYPKPVGRYLADGKRGPGRILENGE